MTEAVHASEKSIISQQITRCSIPEGCHLHTRRRENTKSHKLKVAQPVEKFSAFNANRRYFIAVFAEPVTGPRGERDAFNLHTRLSLLH
jgi:hypothetical protein